MIVPGTDMRALVNAYLCEHEHWLHSNMIQQNITRIRKRIFMRARTLLVFKVMELLCTSHAFVNVHACKREHHMRLNRMMQLLLEDYDTEGNSCFVHKRGMRGYNPE